MYQGSSDETGKRFPKRTGGFGLLESKPFSIVSRGKKIILNSSNVLYVLMDKKTAEIHMSSGRTYETRMTLGELEENLGGGFIKIHRGCIVSVMAIHDITGKINLINGESLSYTVRKKKQIMEQFLSQQASMIQSFGSSDIPATAEEYHRHYSVFDALPFAFTDIEMVFDEEKHAVDWIFRYANSALAKLEKQPLEQLVGSSFGSLFSNMDSKWLHAYERAALYREVLEVIDYSPEIDAYLKIICFPTFKGHCGCILFDISEITLIQNSPHAQRALALYLGNQKNDGLED